MPKTLMLPVAAILALTVLAGACSSDDKKSSNETLATPTSRTSATPKPTTAATAAPRPLRHERPHQRPRLSPNRRPLVVTEPPQADCDPSYPTVCIPSPPPDLDCGQISFRRFKVLSPDPHGFDGDHDGIGCES